MGRYSVSEGRWYGGRSFGAFGSKEKEPAPDPYGPDAPGYHERNRETSTVLRSGIVQVDTGAPVVRLPGEGVRQLEKAAPPPPPQVPPEPFMPPEDPLPALKTVPIAAPKQPWGLNRDGR